MIKIYKNDLDYLKNELKSQNDISDRLQEALLSTRDELEQCKRENIHIKSKFEDNEKKLEEKVIKFYLFSGFKIQSKI